jgi:uncharacterized Tic20 family protein
MPVRDTRVAAAAHLSAVAAVIVVTAVAGGLVVWAGALAFLGPAVVWAACRRASAFVRFHAGEALRFNLSVAVYVGVISAGLQLTTVQTMWTNQLVPFLLLLFTLLALNWAIFILIAAQRAGTGQRFTYPLALRRPRPRRPRPRSTPTYGRPH